MAGILRGDDHKRAPGVLYRKAQAVFNQHARKRCHLAAPGAEDGGLSKLIAKLRVHAEQLLLENIVEQVVDAFLTGGGIVGLDFDGGHG